MEFFTADEVNLICIYSANSRQGVIDELEPMKGHLEPDEVELRELTDSTLEKLRGMSDTEFDALDLSPDFGEGDQDAD